MFSKTTIPLLLLYALTIGYLTFPINVKAYSSDEDFAIIDSFSFLDPIPNSNPDPTPDPGSNPDPIPNLYSSPIPILNLDSNPDPISNLYSSPIPILNLDSNSNSDSNPNPNSDQVSNLPSWSGFVNCEHVQRQLFLDSSQFALGQALNKCWHHGVTLDELELGLTSVAEREDIENYEYGELYLPCGDVFTGNTTKLTTRLVKDYLDCQTAGALDKEVQGFIQRRFADIVEVYTIGNLSVTIDESTMVPCTNASKRISMLCREYGLTEDQWTRGFLRYYYADKWLVEEELTELSIACDQVFNARLEQEVYEEPVKAFLLCQMSMGMRLEMRDLFEKKNAEKLKEFRAQEFPYSPALDLRGYVSCRHLRPLQLHNALVSASWHAYQACKTRGVGYAELQVGVEARVKDDAGTEADNEERDVAELYVDCESVFNEELYSFSTALLNDYESCKEAGRVSGEARRSIQKKFQKLFQMLSATKKLSKSPPDLTAHLVRCVNFTGKLAKLCRRRGSTLAQELRGLGSLARVLGDRWINAEPLERLYVRCDELFDEYARYMKDVPVDQYMQCRWVEEVGEESKKFIDKNIRKLYKNRNNWNGTRYKGDADVEISSVILFDQDE